MKNLLFSLIAILTLSNVSFGQTSKFGIGTTWAIGRKSKNCDGLGICKLTHVTIHIGDDGSDDSGKGIFHSDVLINPKTGLLDLKIDDFNMNKIKSVFGDTILTLEEDFIVDDQELLNSLGVKNYTLKKGTYKFTFNKETSLYEMSL